MKKNNTLIPLFFEDEDYNEICCTDYDKNINNYISNFSFYQNEVHLKKTVISLNDFLSLDTKESIKNLKGFVFHVGRTGSTLFINALKTSIKNVVFSEIDIVTQVLSAENISLAKKKKTIHCIISSYANQEKSKNVFIKFTSLDFLYVNILRDIFPTVPVVFLYNDPIKVISSQMNRPPRWAPFSVPIALSFGYKEKGSTNILRRINAQAFIIQKMYKIALTYSNKDLLALLDYQLFNPNYFTRVIKNAFGVQLSSKKLKNIFLIDAKDGIKKFNYKSYLDNTPQIDSWSISEYKKIDKLYQKLRASN